MALPLTISVFLVVAVPNACSMSTVASRMVRLVPNSSHSKEPVEPGCASGKKIVFIGPSTSRYDYLTLAYYLEHGEWPVDTVDLWEGSFPKDAPEAQPNPFSRPDYCAAGGDWEKFYTFTNRALTSNGGQELCDCWRSAEKWIKDTAENRLYTTRDGKTKLAYFQWWSEAAHPRGVFPHVCPPGAIPSKQWRERNEWDMTLSQFLREVVALVEPTHLVIASGGWKLDSDDYFWHDLIEAGSDAVSAASGTVYWKTPPLNPRGVHHERAEFQADLIEKHAEDLQRHGWKIFPAQKIVEDYRLRSSAASYQVFRDQYSHLTAVANTHVMETFLQDSVCGSNLPQFWSNYSMAHFEVANPMPSSSVCVPDFLGSLFNAGICMAVAMVIVLLTSVYLVRVASTPAASSSQVRPAAQQVIEAQQEAGEIVTETASNAAVPSPRLAQPVTETATSATSRPSTRQPSIEALNGMRTILVSYVILLHYPQGLPSWAKRVLVEGWPMQFFFVLSGFILQYVVSAKLEMMDWSAGLKLIVRRWMRLVPLYEVAIVMRYVSELYFFPGNGRPWIAWPMNVFLLQGLFPIRECIPPGPLPWHHNFVHFTANGVGWFTSILASVTCCFPVLYNKLPRRGAAKILFLLFGILFVRALPELARPAWGCWNVGMRLPPEECHGSFHLYSFAPLRLLEFAAGMLTSSLVKLIPDKFEAVPWGWVFDGLLVLASYSVYWSIKILGSSAHFTGDYFLTPVWCMVCGAACMGAKQRKSFPSNVGPLYAALSSWPLAPLGQYSFEAYILHSALIVPFLHGGIRWMTLPWNMILVWATAFVVDHFLQEPLTKMVNARLNQK